VGGCWQCGPLLRGRSVSSDKSNCRISLDPSGELLRERRGSSQNGTQHTEAWRCLLAVPATGEAEAGEWLAPRSSFPAWATSETLCLFLSFLMIDQV
jgi:hypothetical protein